MSSSVNLFANTSNIKIEKSIKTVPVDNIDLRFQAVYDIIKDSWIKDDFVRNDQETLNISNPERYIHRLSKKYLKKNEIPSKAPEGLGFCLAGATMYAGGPTEEQIMSALAMAVIIKTQGCNFLTMILNDSVFYDMCALSHYDNRNEYNPKLKIGETCKKINQWRNDEIFARLYLQGTKKNSDEFKENIYTFNDVSSKKEVLNLIKLAKNVHSIATAILANTVQYDTPTALKKALKTK